MTTTAVATTAAPEPSELEAKYPDLVWRGKSKDILRLGIVNAEGALTRLMWVEVYSDYYWRRLQMALGHMEVDDPDRPGEKLWVLRLTQEQAKWRTRSLKPLMCAFRATDEYLQNRFGLRLHRDDEQWYQEHPLIEPDGLPMHATARVIQELVAPYDLRVTRIQVSAGLILPGDDWKSWARKWLGCNPLGYVDRITSNPEFAERMSMPLAEVNQQYGFEYTDSPLMPGLHFGVVSVGTTSDGGTAGATGGHTTYASARARRSVPIMSVQLARLAEAPWPGEVPSWPETEANPEHLQEKDFDVLDTWNALPEDLKKEVNAEAFRLFPLRSGNYYHQAPKAAATHSGTRHWSDGAIKQGTHDGWGKKEAPAVALASTDRVWCCHCSKYAEYDAALGGSHTVCSYCWADVWTWRDCGKCNTPLGPHETEHTYTPPKIVKIARDEHSKWYVTGKCQECGAHNTLHANSSPEVEPFVIGATAIEKFTSAAIIAATKWWDKHVHVQEVGQWQ